MNSYYFKVLIYTRNKLHYCVEMPEFINAAMFGKSCVSYITPSYYDCEVVIKHCLACEPIGQHRTISVFKCEDVDAIMRHALYYSKNSTERFKSRPMPLTQNVFKL
tara:strand:+ start:10256 stop:10573 length:318 start_codon:yes stop_codon:yes gene_type:complete